MGIEYLLIMFIGFVSVVNGILLIINEAIDRRDEELLQEAIKLKKDGIK